MRGTHLKEDDSSLPQVALEAWVLQDICTTAVGHAGGFGSCPGSPGTALGLRAAAPLWLRIGEGRHSAVTCTGYILLEELLHNQMHLCAIDYLQRKGEI